MDIALAFYCGRGGPLDATIRFATRSAFSHVEIIDLGRSDSGNGTPCISSSFRDGGVRRKLITLRADHWKIVRAPWAARDAWARAEEHLGAGYDYLGVALSQILALRRGDRRRWFCSELCAMAIGLNAPVAFSPGGLFEAVQDMNRVYRLGCAVAGEPPED
jgi:hypothetical protein